MQHSKSRTSLPETLLFGNAGTGSYHHYQLMSRLAGHRTSSNMRLRTDSAKNVIVVSTNNNTQTKKAESRQIQQKSLML